MFYPNNVYRNNKRFNVYTQIEISVPICQDLFITHSQKSRFLFIDYKFHSCSHQQITGLYCLKVSTTNKKKFINKRARVAAYNIIHILPPTRCKSCKRSVKH